MPEPLSGMVSQDWRSWSWSTFRIGLRQCLQRMGVSVAGRLDGRVVMGSGGGSEKVARNTDEAAG